MSTHGRSRTGRTAATSVVTSLRRSADVTVRSTSLSLTLPRLRVGRARTDIAVRDTRDRSISCSSGTAIDICGTSRSTTGAAPTSAAAATTDGSAASKTVACTTATIANVANSGPARSSGVRDDLDARSLSAGEQGRHDESGCQGQPGVRGVRRVHSEDGGGESESRRSDRGRRFRVAEEHHCDSGHPERGRGDDRRPRPERPGQQRHHRGADAQCRSKGQCGPAHGRAAKHDVLALRRPPVRATPRDGPLHDVQQAAVGDDLTDRRVERDRVTRGVEDHHALVAHREQGDAHRVADAHVGSQCDVPPVGAGLDAEAHVPVTPGSGRSAHDHLPPVPRRVPGCHIVDGTTGPTSVTRTTDHPSRSG